LGSCDKGRAVERLFDDGSGVLHAEPFLSLALLWKYGHLWAGVAWACPIDVIRRWSLESVLFIRSCDQIVMLIRRLLTDISGDCCQVTAVTAGLRVLEQDSQRHRLKLLRVCHCLFVPGVRCSGSEQGAAGVPFRVAGVAEREFVVLVGVVNNAARHPGNNTTVDCFWLSGDSSLDRQGLWDMGANGGALVRFEYLVSCDAVGRFVVRVVTRPLVGVPVPVLFPDGFQDAESLAGCRPMAMAPVSGRPPGLA